MHRQGPNHTGCYMYALLRVLDIIPKDVESHLRDLNRNVTGSDSYFKNYSDMAFFTSDWSFFMLLKRSLWMTEDGLEASRRPL